MSTRTIKQWFPGFVFAGALLLGLGACQTSPPPAETSGAPTPGVFSIPPGSTEYRVSGQESELRIFVYRGGPMARLGHKKR